MPGGASHTRLKELFEKGSLWVAAPRGATTTAEVPRTDKREQHRAPFLDFNSGTIHEWSSDTFTPLSILSYLASIHARKEVSSSPWGTPHQTKAVIWIGKAVWPTPFLLHAAFSEEQKKRCICLDVSEQRTAEWTIEKVLASRSVGVVICDLPRLSFQASRRFAIAAKKGGTLGFFIRPERSLASSTVSTSKWHISAHPSSNLSPSWKIELLKMKGPEPQAREWIVECEYEEKLSLSVLPSLVSEHSREELPQKQFG